MKIKKNYIYTALVVVVLVILSIFLSNGKATYDNIDSPRPILGDKNAKVNVVEFSDFQCPACKFTAGYPHQLLTDFGDKISIEYKHFPLSFHENAFKAAEASECANDQGLFWEYSTNLFINQDKLKVKDLKKHASNLELDTKLFNACLDSGAKKDYVESNIRDGYAKNLRGTPSFYINGVLAESIKYEDIKAEIQRLLNE